MPLTQRQLELELRRWDQEQAAEVALLHMADLTASRIDLPSPDVFLARDCFWPHMETRKPVASLNAMQLDYMERRTSFRLDDLGRRTAGRDTILKCRKMRFTSMFLGLILYYMLKIPRLRCVSVFQVAKQEILRPIRDRFLFALEHLPNGWGDGWYKAGGIVYLANGSNWVAVTSGSSEDGAGKVGRSGDIDVLHLSEPQQYLYPDECFSAAVDAMPPGAGWVISEGTSPSSKAQWHAATFFEAYTGPDTASALFDRAFFYPWYWDEMKRLRAGSSQYERVMGEAFTAALGPETLAREAHLRARHGVTDEQIAFRRLNYFTGSPTARRKARREHPEEPEDGFQYRGNQHFDSVSVQAIRDGCREPDHVVRLTVTIRASFWCEPGSAGFIVCAVDPARFGADYTAAQFLDAATGAQLGELHGRGLPSEISGAVEDALDWLGVLRTGRHVVWVERSNQQSGGGDTLVREMQLSGRVLLGTQREASESRRPRIGLKRRLTRLPGFSMSGSSRGRVFDALREAVQGSELGDGTFEGPTAEINSKYLAAEIGWIVDIDGRPEAGEDDRGRKAHDDLVIAYGIARWFLPVAPKSTGVGGYNEPARRPASAGAFGAEAFGVSAGRSSGFGIPDRSGGMG